MTAKQAIKIVMESPRYYRLQIIDRHVLVQAFRNNLTMWS